MDDLERVTTLRTGLVCRVEAGKHAADDGRDHGERDGAFLVACCSQDRPPRIPEDVLHDEQDLALVRDDVERRNDVRMMDARGNARLIEEHRDEIRVLREMRVQALDRYGARESARSN